MPLAMEEIQRALGRVEGKLDRILAAQDKQDEEMAGHKAEDRENFQAVSSRFGLVYSKLGEQDASRAQSFAKMERQLGVINGYVDNIKGAWWMITILVVVIGGIGAAVAWAFGLIGHGGRP